MVMDTNGSRLVTSAHSIMQLLFADLQVQLRPFYAVLVVDAEVLGCSRCHVLPYPVYVS